MNAVSTACLGGESSLGVCSRIVVGETGNYGVQQQPRPLSLFKWSWSATVQSRYLSQVKFYSNSSDHDKSSNTTEDVGRAMQC